MKRLALAALVLVGGCTPAGAWTVAYGPWEDGSLILEAPNGAKVGACIADAICEEGTP